MPKAKIKRMPFDTECKSDDGVGWNWSIGGQSFVYDTSRRGFNVFLESPGSSQVHRLIYAATLRDAVMYTQGLVAGMASQGD